MTPRVWPLVTSLVGATLIAFSLGCQNMNRANDAALIPSSASSHEVVREKTFTEDVTFLRKHVETLVLTSGRSKIAVVPAYQGRVMTSSTGAEADTSMGWLNYRAIEEGILEGAAGEGKLQAHIHVFGGEERFWLGPEGGQFGIYFAPGAPFEFEDWKTPAPIDTESFAVLSQTDSSVVFRREFSVQNHSGHRFDVEVRRVVSILERSRIAELLGIELGSEIDVVAYESRNQIANRGDAAWTPETGALSIWLLGMYKHSLETTVVIPVETGDSEDLGPIVNDEYFGKVPDDRLRVNSDVLFFRADGQYRSKIGVTPQRSLGVAGSYAADTKTLNLVLYERPSSHAGYVNSMWAVQEEPYSGDTINSYNDGSPEPGAAPLGPFYELETSSPAAFLAPGESLEHVQRTIHIRGPQAVLDEIALKHLGVAVDEVVAAF